MTLEFIDSHAHLSAPEFQGDVDEVIQRAKQAGLVHIVTIGAGYGKKSAEEALSLAEKYDCISAVVGLHPCDSTEKIESKWLSQIANHEKVVGLGETGLDYYWKKTDPEIQKYNFNLHIEVAKELKLPLIIHSREAAEECIDILIRADAQKVGGVFHCFSENADFAKRLLEINFKVSFPGVLSFKKADALRQVAKEIPLEQIMIETDCPFLAPQRVRGKRCEPAYVVDVAQTLAQIKNCSLEQIAKSTTANAKKFFSL